ncbi:peptidylprolyl isomerase [bacterium]|nr:peptidylprolyl isomerase [bacterium]
MRYRNAAILASFCICFTFLMAYASPVLIDSIIAVANQEVITLSDLILMEKRIYGTNGFPQGLSDDTKIRIREKILQDLIDERLMIGEAKRLDLTPSNAEVVEQIEQIKAKNGWLSDRALEESLAKDGLKIEDFKKRILEDISLLKIRRHVAYRNIQVTDQEILKYYETEWTGHEEGVRVRLSHILLKFASDSSQGQNTGILKKAKKIMDEWEQGEPFSALADKYSEDTSAGPGGDLGTFYLKDLRPEFSDAFTNLQPGKIAGPVRTEAGYHILYLEERKESGLEKASAIWKKIEETIIEKKKADFYEAWINRLRREATIDIHGDALGRSI